LPLAFPPDPVGEACDLVELVGIETLDQVQQRRPPGIARRARETIVDRACDKLRLAVGRRLSTVGTVL
jgi:hypothetical protein